MKRVCQLNKSANNQQYVFDFASLRESKIICRYRDRRAIYERSIGNYIIYLYLYISYIGNIYLNTHDEL